jgi:hypothetical protein
MNRWEGGAPVTPPALEIADLIRTAGAAFVERNRQWIRWKHVKVLRAIARCRTAALGGHLNECTRCAHRGACPSLVLGKHPEELTRLERALPERFLAQFIRKHRRLGRSRRYPLHFILGSFG